MSDYRLTMHRGKFALTWHETGHKHPRRISTGTNDRGEAEAVARQIWHRINAAQSERLRDLWPIYTADRIADGARANRFAAHWTALMGMFGNRIGSSITRADCRLYYQSRKAAGYSDSTIKTDLELLRACLRRHYGAAAAPPIWIPPGSKPRDNCLTKAQARTIVQAAATPHIRLFVILGLTTGARAGAILDLEWSRVDFAQGTIDYRSAGRAETNKRRTIVPMNAVCRAALDEAAAARQSDHVIEWAGGPVKSVKKAVARLAERTAITFSPHTLRHTCAVWMAQDNVPMQMISQYLGHTSLRMTEQVYARYSPNFMTDASAATMF